MNEIIDELAQIILELDAVVSESKFQPVAGPLKALENSARRVGKAWCGSFLGYHSRVYYENLKKPPPGANFSPEWGLHGSFNFDTTGVWYEFDFDDVRQSIFFNAGNPDLAEVKALAIKTRLLFDAKKADVDSLLAILSLKSDTHLDKLQSEIVQLRMLYAKDYIEASLPRGQISTRDSLAASQGFITPPHLSVEAEVMEYKFAFQGADGLSKLLKLMYNHLGRKGRLGESEFVSGKRVFIGHGGSNIWKDLKDFLQDRLKLEWDEFNRIPVAGVANTARLSQMLDGAGIAFLVLTAEDERADGKMQARMNVIHEAGLFQGKLGFTKALILLEEGCEEFTNIQGLGQVRFQHGKLKEIFEDIRQILERERIL